MAPPWDNDSKLDRRTLMSSTVAALTAATGTAAGEHRDERRESFVLTATVRPGRDYQYLPFEVPEGVRRIDLELSNNNEQTATIGFGLFDHRGPQYQSDGFRGSYGTERRSCHLSARDASLSFLPGPIGAGTWTVMLFLFEVLAPTTVAVRVTFTYGTERHPKPIPNRSVPPQSTEEGWYAGELHCHTEDSSDAWASGSALSPAGWAKTADSLGLDFVSLTDHNGIKQNRKRFDAMRNQRGNVLLIGGEEMTSPHGHATITGLDADQWVDFRQRPAGQPLQKYEARIQQFAETTREYGAYTAIAHPMLRVSDNGWDYFPDTVVDPAAQLDGIEVWNGPYTPDDEGALRFWDRLLQEGYRLTANGGSDTHGTDDPTFGTLPGIPTTHVYATELSTDGIVSGLKQGRVTISNRPDGPQLTLHATAADQRAMIGGTVAAPRSATVEYEATISDGSGNRLLFIRDGTPIHVEPIDEDEAKVTVTGPVGTGGYIRLELRGRPDLRPEAPRRSRGDIKALTNPVFIEPRDEGAETTDSSGSGDLSTVRRRSADETAEPSMPDFERSEHTHDCCGW